MRNKLKLLIIGIFATGLNLSLPSTGYALSMQSSGNDCAIPGKVPVSDIVIPSDLDPSAENFPIKPFKIDRRPAVVLGLRAYNTAGHAYTQAAMRWNPMAHPGVTLSAWNGLTVDMTQDIYGPDTDGDYRPDPVDGGDGVVDSANFLIERLNGLYDQGWRRIILHRPTGYHSDRPPAVPSNAMPADSIVSFHAMPDYKKEVYGCHLKRWKRQHPEVSLEIFIVPSYAQYTNYYTVRPRDGWADRASVAEVVNEWRAWANSGIDVIWLDESAAAYEDIQNLNNSPNMITRDGRKILFGGENFRKEGCAGVNMWNYDDVSNSQICKHLPTDAIPYITSNQFSGWINGHEVLSVDFDPSTTASNVMLNREASNPNNKIGIPDNSLFLNAQTVPDLVGYDFDKPFDVISALKQQGHVIWAMNNSYHESTKRIFDFGEITCPADLDMDGDVTTADYNMFMDVFQSTQQRSQNRALTIMDGDLYPDDQINSADYFLFVSMYTADECPTIDYGPNDVKYDNQVLNVYDHKDSFTNPNTRPSDLIKPPKKKGAKAARGARAINEAAVTVSGKQSSKKAAVTR